MDTSASRPSSRPQPPPAAAAAAEAARPRRPDGVAAAAAAAPPPSLSAAAATASSAMTLVFAKRKRIRKKTPRELADDDVRLAQDSRLYNLTLDVNNLKQEIHTLDVQRRLLAAKRLATRAMPSGSSAKLIRHYFGMYRHGLDMHKPMHYDFIHACMDPDMHLGITPFGIDTFFEQWRLHTQLFQIRLIDLVTIDVVSSDDESCVVRCVVQNHGRLSRQTIATVFPSALADEALVAKLVGREIVTCAEMVFYVNNDQRVARLDVDVDMVDAFSQILHRNPHDIAALMGIAMIAEESVIVPAELSAASEETSSSSTGAHQELGSELSAASRAPASAETRREEERVEQQLRHGAEGGSEGSGREQSREHHSLRFILSAD